MRVTCIGAHWDHNRRLLRISVSVFHRIEMGVFIEWTNQCPQIDSNDAIYIDMCVCVRVACIGTHWDHNRRLLRISVSMFHRIEMGVFIEWTNHGPQIDSNDAIYIDMCVCA